MLQDDEVVSDSPLEPKQPPPKPAKLPSLETEVPESEVDTVPSPEEEQPESNTGDKDVQVETESKAFL